MIDCTCTIGKEKNSKCLVHGIKISDVGDEIVRVYPYKENEMINDLEILSIKTPEQRIQELEEIIIQKENTIKELQKPLFHHPPTHY